MDDELQILPGPPVGKHESVVITMVVTVAIYGKIA